MVVSSCSVVPPAAAGLRLSLVARHSHRHSSFPTGRGARSNWVEFERWLGQHAPRRAALCLSCHRMNFIDVLVHGDLLEFVLTNFGHYITLEFRYGPAA